LKIVTWLRSTSDEVRGPGVVADGGSGADEDGDEQHQEQRDAKR